MSTIADSRLTRAIRVWIDLAFVLGLVACAGLAVWLLISPFIMAGSRTGMDAAIPVAIGSRSVRPVIPVETLPKQGDTIHSLQIVDARGELRFVTSSWELQFASNLAYLVGALVVVAVIYLVRSVLQEVTKGTPFGPTGAKRIRAIGLLFILISILRPITEYVTARLVLARISTVSPALSPPLSLSLDAFLAGLLILIVSQIWAYGAELAHEQSLTI
jgi:hypothetical protein